MVTETNPMKKEQSPAQKKKAEKEEFLASAPSNIETLSSLVKSQQEKAQTLKKAAAEAPEMARRDVASLERGASEALYNLDPRQMAARGFEVQADFADRAATMRQAAADRQMQLQQQAFDEEQEALTAQATMREQLEEEATLEVTNAITLADSTIAKYYEAGEEWPMYQEAWQISQTLDSPQAFEAFWSGIQASYNELGGDHTSPMAHPLVRYNIQVGNPPLEGLTLRDTEEDGQKYPNYLKGQRLLAELNTPEGMMYDEESNTYVAEAPQEEAAV